MRQQLPKALADNFLELFEQLNCIVAASSASFTEILATMSTARVARLRVCRPQLSLRYQCLRRQESNTAASTIAESTALPATPPTPPPPPPPPPKPSFFREYRGTIIFGAVSLSLGLGAGSFATAFFGQSMPAPGTPEDDVLLADLTARIDHDFKVSVLRGKCLGVARQLKGAEAGWVEVVSAAEKPGVAGGPLVSELQGARGLGVERVFYNRHERQLVAVVWFGSSLSGWPTVTHGGLLATALTEKIALTAQLARESASNNSAAALPQRMPGTGNHAKMPAPKSPPADQPAALTLSYISPTKANSFYVTRVSPALFSAQTSIVDEPTPSKTSKPPPRVRDPFTTGTGYEATIETMGGKVLVMAQAQMPESPSAATLIDQAERTMVDGAKEKYDEFRQWLWPSRQQRFN